MPILKGVWQKKGEKIMLKIDNKKVTPNQVAKEIVLSTIDSLQSNVIDHHLKHGSTVFGGEPTARERRLIIIALKKQLIRMYALYGVDIQADFEQCLAKEFYLRGEA